MTIRRRAATNSPGRRRSASERRANKHVHDGVSEDEFVAMRQERDKGLARRGC